MQIFYTYVWKKSDGSPFYVGKGVGNRYRSMACRSSDFMEEINNGGCEVEILQRFELESDAFSHEKQLIKDYGRLEFGGILVNKTVGGEGSSRSRLGKLRRQISRDHARTIGPTAKNQTGYKGVSIQFPGRWVAKLDGKYLGLFKTPSEAAMAYDKAARKKWGEKCYLNFPLSHNVRKEMDNSCRGVYPSSGLAHIVLSRQFIR